MQMKQFKMLLEKVKSNMNFRTSQADSVILVDVAQSISDANRAHTNDSNFFRASNNRGRGRPQRGIFRGSSRGQNRNFPQRGGHVNNRGRGQFFGRGNFQPRGGNRGSFYQANNRNLNENNNRPQNQIQCFNCGRYGHKANQCYFAQNASRGGNGTSSQK